MKLADEICEDDVAIPPRGTPSLLRADPERLIAIGRLLISSFGLGAVYLDPTQPTNLVNDAYWILAGYVFWSFLLLFAQPTRRLAFAYQLTTTAIDIGIVGVLVYVTGELESPFLIFYTFLLISAAIRWEWAGTLTVAAILQGILLYIGLPDIEDGESELNFLIIRSVFCWVIVLLLGYFGSYRNRSNQRLRELASWPHDMLPEDDHPWLASALRHASMVLGATSIIVVWRDRDQAIEQAAIWHDQSCRFFDRLEPANTIFPQIDDNSTVELDAARHGEVLDRLAEQFSLPGSPWRDLFLSSFSTIRFAGCVIVADPTFPDQDTRLLTRIIASRIAMELEQFSLVREYASAAGLKERVRIARDLHDSILQDLTAAVLQIDAVQRAGSEREAALSCIREMLQANQKRLRLLVQDARQEAGQRSRLADQLQMFVGPLGTQWGCQVELEVDPPDLHVSEVVATELCLALSEATANAARHGGARNLKIVVRRTREQLSVLIDDDGTGGHADSVPHPVSIDTRIRELGGTLAVHREDAGLKLRLAIPLELAPR